MLKNKSYFKKSFGDEAGCAPKKGVLTSVNRGKVYFTAWSMDVKYEGENVVRHLDLTTHNHASFTSNTPPWHFIDTTAAPPADHPCRSEIEETQEACKGAVTSGSGAGARRDCTQAKGDCQKRMACILVPKNKDKQLCCAPHNTGHHMVPAHTCRGVTSGYKEGDAPTVCAGGWSWHRERRSGIPSTLQSHADFHEIQDPIERKILRIVGKLAEKGKHHNPALANRTQQKPWKYRTVRSISVSAHKKTFRDAKCSNKCLMWQLDQYHLSEEVGMTKDTLLNAGEHGNKISPDDYSYIIWTYKFPDLKPP